MFKGLLFKSRIVARCNGGVRNFGHLPKYFDSEQANTWKEIGKEIHWFKPFSKTIESIDTAPYYRWYADGETNMCYNCLDRHVLDGYGTQVALVYRSALTGEHEYWTYDMLLDSVKSFAGVLLSHGVKKGDRVIIYMPNSSTAAIAMLACARIGSIHSVVFGGFAAHELAVRIRDCTPKIVICSSCGIEGGKTINYKNIVDEAIDIAERELSASGKTFQSVEKCIVYQRSALSVDLNQSIDRNWDDEIAKFDQESPKFLGHFHDIPCVAMKSYDPLYVLYTSGTTGQPKGIVRDTGGYAAALKWSMFNIYGMSAGDVWWAASDVGWVVGHSYGVYGPLLQRCTTVLFEGKPVGTPNAGAYWKVIEDFKVNGLFCAPTTLRAIRQVDPNASFIKKHNISSLKYLFIAGERADASIIKWTESVCFHNNVPVLDNWWQTESGWPITANMIGYNKGLAPIKYGSAFRPVLGHKVHVFDSEEAVDITKSHQVGRIALKLPLPPGFMTTIFNNEKRFRDGYLSGLPGYYDSGDSGFVDEDGYVHIMTRTDDVINVSGHRLSTGSMEEILLSHPDIVEVAVVGVADKLKGQLPLGLYVLSSKSTKSAVQVTSEVITMVRDQIGAIACFKKAYAVPALPKTRSGKILRGTLRSIADGKVDYKVPATIENPAVLKAVEEIIRENISIESEE